MRIRVQAIGVPSEFKKNKVTLLMMHSFFKFTRRGKGLCYKRIFYLGIRALCQKKITPINVAHFNISNWCLPKFAR